MALQGPTVNHPEIPASAEQLSNRQFYMSIAFPEPQNPVPGSEVITEVGVNMNTDERGTNRTYFFGPAKLDSVTGQGIRDQLQAIIDDPTSTNRDIMDWIVNLVANAGDERTSGGAGGASGVAQQEGYGCVYRNATTLVPISNILTTLVLFDSVSVTPVGLTPDLPMGEVAIDIAGVWQIEWKVALRRTTGGPPVSTDALRMLFTLNNAPVGGSEASVTLVSDRLSVITGTVMLQAAQGDVLRLAAESLAGAFDVDVSYASASMTLMAAGGP